MQWGRHDKKFNVTVAIDIEGHSIIYPMNAKIEAKGCFPNVKIDPFPIRGHP